MKKLAFLLIFVSVLIIAAVPVFGEGIFVASGSGDNIRILEDADITAPISGNVIVVLGNIFVEDKVNGHVISVFGDAEVNSEVAGQVVTLFGKTSLREKAVIMGDVITIGSLDKASGARVLGQEVRMLGSSMNLDIDAISYLQLVTMILFTLAVLVVGLLAILISKTKYKNISKNLEKNLGRKMLLGLLSFLGASALLVLLLVTLIGPALYIAVLVMSTITACMFLGRLILKTFSQNNSIYMEFITGLISITLVKLLIIFLAPQQKILLSLGLVGLLNFAVYSLGLGIHIEQHYLRNNEANPNRSGGEGSGNAKTA